MDTALWWVRNDARLHDNAALAAAAEADRLLPVYCVDPRQYGQQPYGGRPSFEFEKTGPYRAQFRKEAVAELRESLEDAGSALLVREGRPEDVLPEVAAAVDAEEGTSSGSQTSSDDADVVHFQALPAPEERDAARAVVSALANEGVRTESHWTHTLHHVADLPEGVDGIADTFTPFRQSVESDSRVREPIPEPELPEPPALGELGDRGSFPSLDDLGLSEPEYDDRGVLAFEGGETAGLDRLEGYVWEGDHLREYKQTRNGMLGADYSSKLSPWLNAGCLSPRYVKREVDRYEDERVANDSTYWLLFELRWRDFMAFQTAKHGGQFFSLGGIRERDDIDWGLPDADPAAREQFERWARGETGIPFVDASMRELNETGYTSNRGRQNVASFLANSLRIDWRHGAAYFETQLVDYDPGSNYGNWAYVAGVGNDSRNSYFDVVKQARQYDGDGEYVRHWLPELRGLQPAYVHEPWEMDREEQAAYGVVLGEDYPEPMVDLEASYAEFR